MCVTFGGVAGVGFAGGGGGGGLALRGGGCLGGAILWTGVCAWTAQLSVSRGLCRGVVCVGGEIGGCCAACLAFGAVGFGDSGWVVAGDGATFYADNVCDGFAR